MTEVDTLIGDTSEFLTTVLRKLKEHGIRTVDYECDHLCFRARSASEYIRLRTELSNFGYCLVEGMIGGRPIATFQLERPIKHTDTDGTTYYVNCIELASPKPSKSHTFGLEHCEFAIGSLAAAPDLSFLRAFMHLYPAVKFDTKALAKENNPDVSLSLGKYSVKFHQHPLSEVCKRERDEGLVVPVPEDYFTINDM